MHNEETIRQIARQTLPNSSFNIMLKEIDALREALTPSAETKGDYSGEFQFESYDHMSVTVPWTTVKEIMAHILKRATSGGSEHG